MLITSKQNFITTIRIAAPLAVAAVATMGLEVVDTVMMGWLGREQLAGGAVVNAIYLFLAATMAGMMTSVGVSVANAVGAGDRNRIKTIIDQGLIFVMLVSIPIVTLLWHADDVARFFGQPESVLVYVRDYARYFAFGMPSVLLFFVSREILAGIAKPRFIMIVSLLAIPLNFLGNYCLMYGKYGFPEMGVAGIGLSTNLVGWLMFFTLFFVIKGQSILKGTGVYSLAIRFNKDEFLGLLKLGGPASFSFGFESSLFSITALMMGAFGEIALAGHQIAIMSASTVFMIPYGVSQATAVRVGQGFGAQNLSEVYRATAAGMICGLILAAISSLAFWCVPGVFVDVFLDLNDADNQAVYDLAVAYLAIAALFQLVDSVQVIFAGALRGMRDTFYPMLNCLFSYSVTGLGAGALMAFYFGLEGRGLWFGLALGLGVSAILMGIRYRIVTSKLRQTFSVDTLGDLANSS